LAALLLNNEHSGLWLVQRGKPSTNFRGYAAMAVSKACTSPI
jgi:hypothetical protein